MDIQWLVLILEKKVADCITSLRFSFVRPLTCAVNHQRFSTRFCLLIFWKRLRHFVRRLHNRHLCSHQNSRVVRRHWSVAVLSTCSLQRCVLQVSSVYRPGSWLFQIAFSFGQIMCCLFLKYLNWAIWHLVVLQNKSETTNATGKVWADGLNWNKEPVWAVGRFWSVSDLLAGLRSRALPRGNGPFTPENCLPLDGCYGNQPPPHWCSTRQQHRAVEGERCGYVSFVLISPVTHHHLAATNIRQTIQYANILLHPVLGLLCLRAFPSVKTMAYISFVSGWSVMHADVMRRHHNICHTSACCSPTCPSTCQLDAVGCLHCYFYDLAASLCVRVCVRVCPGEVDDVLDSVCLVHHGGDGHGLVPIMVSQELLLALTY